MDSSLFRSKFEEIRSTFFSHESFVINDEEEEEDIELSSYQPQVSNEKPISMNEIKLRKQLAASRNIALLKAIQSRKKRVCTRIESIKATASSRDSLYQLKLASNLDVSDRRLQELIFECLGEYEKARGRAVRRSVHLSSTIDEKLHQRRDDHEWAFFLSKLEDEFPNFTFEDISSMKMTIKYSELCSYFNDITSNRSDIVGSSGAIPKVTRIVQISHRSGRAPRKRRDNSNIVSKLLSCDSSIGTSLGDLMRGTIPTSKHSEDGRVDVDLAQEEEDGEKGSSFPTTTFLSSRPLSWLLLSPPEALLDRPNYHNLTLANCRIYFHVEDRVRRISGGGIVSGDSAQAISEYYCSMKEGGGNHSCMKDTNGKLLTISESLGNHRKSPDLSEFPDVLVHNCKEGKQHFATATIQQLQETKLYAENVLRSQQYALKHLYMAVNVKKEDMSSNHTLKLISIPNELMLVLFDTYTTKRGRKSSLLSSSDIIPKSAVNIPRSFFCLVRSPNYQPSVEADPEETSPSPFAFLFQFNRQDVSDSEKGKEDSPIVSQKSKTHWDGTILWNFCRWRSCLAPATASPSPRYLCTHHSLLKQLLEASKKKNESAKFLPRKPPVFQTSDSNDPDLTVHDLKMIKAASSLVEELADDKLAATIEGFCQRVGSDHALLRQRHCSRFNSFSPPSPPSHGGVAVSPTWKRWGSPGTLERTLSEIEHNQRAASTCLKLETITTSEIQALCNSEIGGNEVGGRPEVALIQRELESTDLFDVKSSQRKFELISSLVHHMKSAQS